MATLVLAAGDPNHTVDQIYVSPLQVLYFNRPERCIPGQNCREIDRLPIEIAACNLQESVLLFVGQCAAKRRHRLGPVRTVVWQGSAGDRRPYADQIDCWPALLGVRLTPPFNRRGVQLLPPIGGFCTNIDGAFISY